MVFYDRIDSETARTDCMASPSPVKLPQISKYREELVDNRNPSWDNVQSKG